MAWCTDLEKAEFRAKIRKRLSELDESYISESDLGIFDHLIVLPRFLNAERVFLYYSVGREVDTTRLMDFCVSRNIPFALPRPRAGGLMDFAIVPSRHGPLVPGLHNIPEPPPEAPPAIPTGRDIIIVPALCYDTFKYRMGHGSGYYDNYLDGCPAVSVGLCREKLIYERIPRESHDIPVDILVSEIEMRNR